MCVSLLPARQVSLMSEAPSCMQGWLDTLQAEDGRLMQAAGDIFATSQAASTLADVSEAWRLAPDLGAALLAGDCLQLLQGDSSTRLSLCSAVMCCTPHIGDGCGRWISHEVP